jgi:hypothetical protein
VMMREVSPLGFVLSAEGHESLRLFTDPELQCQSDSSGTVLAGHRIRALEIFRKAELLAEAVERCLLPQHS